jgi:uncharacterized RDD family membrane protein YckC
VKVARSQCRRQNRAPKEFAAMNSSDPQSESGSETHYFDPEQLDSTEQQFAVSLEANSVPAQFLVEASAGIESSSAKLPSTQEIDATRVGLEHAEADALVGVADNGKTQIDDPASVSGPDWRDLVSAKVNSYKTRKPQAVRYPSLQIPLDSGNWRPKNEPSFASYIESEIEQQPEAPARSSELRLPVFMESTARVLEFPRSSAPPVRLDELAESVIDRPRIVEAPELLPPPPAMGGIMIEGPEQPDPERRPGFDLPLRSAGLSRRMLAGASDLLVIVAATILFGYIALRIVGAAPPWRTEFEIVAGLVAVMWPVYQYCFLVYCGRTLGLRAAGLHLKQFDGGSPSRNTRRWRVIASLMSAAALGFGYWWCLLDEDQLSWHDRITRTHLSPSNSASPA